MNDADDTTTGPAVVAMFSCRCGAPVVVHLTGGVCSCGAKYAAGEASEAVALSEMPGGQRRRPTFGDT